MIRRFFIAASAAAAIAPKMLVPAERTMVDAELGANLTFNGGPIFIDSVVPTTFVFEQYRLGATYYFPMTMTERLLKVGGA
jgi:hypothetical protein